MTETPPSETSRPLRVLNLLPLVAVAVAAGIFAYQQDLVPDLRAKRDSYPADTLPAPQHTLFESPITGARYNIWVQPPHGYNESDKTFPVFYVLNGAAAIAAHDQLVLPLVRDGKVPEAIFVGIDQVRSIGNPFFAGIVISDPRLRDYTFFNEENARFETGGAPEFLEFFRDNIIPYIDATYRTIPEDRGLGGFSLEGLFVMYAALTDPGLFQRYVVLSPQLFRGDFAILELEEELARKRDDLPISLYLSIGDMESPDYRRGWEAMIDALLVRDYPNFRFKYEMHAQSDRNAAVLPGAHNGLAFVYESGS